MSNYISKAETNKIIRKCLKEAFPTVKFSVKGSGRDATRIYWTDGPNNEQVSAVTKRFQSSGFDGMQDYQYNIYQEMNGEKINFGTDYIFNERSLSDEKTQQTIDLVFNKNKQLFADNNESKPTLATWYNVYLDIGGDYFITEMRKRLSKISFTKTNHSATAASVKVTGSEYDDYTASEETRQENELNERHTKALKEIEQLELDLKPTMTGKTKVKSIYVEWSECSALKSETTYTLQAFEDITNNLNLNGHSCYYKTKINVIFADDNEYACRIDLSPGCNGFYQHMIALIAYITKNNDYRESIKSSNPELLKFYLSFFQTYQLKSQTEQSNVTNLNSFKAEKEQQTKAENFANELINSIEPPTFDTKALALLIKSAANIMYFSGDVEPGESRTVKQCDPKSLTRAASLQLFSVELLPDAVRLSFDGEYIYDLYFHSYITSELKNQLLTLLADENESNANQANIKQQAFNAKMNSLLKH